MSRCLPSERDQARAAAENLAALEIVDAADVLPPSKGVRDRWSVDVLVSTAAGGVPPTIADIVARHELTIELVQRQGRHRNAVFVV